MPVFKESQVEQRGGSHPVELSVHIAGSLGAGDHKTHSVHKAGIFVVTDDPAPPKQLLKLSVVTPHLDTIAAWGSVVHVVQPEEASPQQPAGMAIQFFTMDGGSQATWNRVIEELSHERAKGQKGSSRNTSSRDGFRRTPTSSARHTPMPLPAASTEGETVHLRPRSIRSLVKLVNVDLPRGRISVPSADGLAPGTSLIVVVQHPTSGMCVSLPGQVESRNDTGTLGVTVDGLSQADWRTLQRFAITGIPRG